MEISVNGIQIILKPHLIVEVEYYQKLSRTWNGLLLGKFVRGKIWTYNSKSFLLKHCRHISRVKRDLVFVNNANSEGLYDDVSQKYYKIKNLILKASLT